MQSRELHRQALSCLQRGDFPAMVRACRAILTHDDRFADAWFLLSVAADAAGDLARAVQLVDRALALAAANAEYLAQKAKYHARANQMAQALDAAERALAAQPEGALVFDTLGVVLTRLGRYQQALELLTRAVELRPDDPQFNFNLAAAAQFIGNAELARRHYRAATAHRPGFLRAHWALSELQREPGQGSGRQALLALRSRPDLSTQDALYLGHALARDCEVHGEYAQAFAYLSEGKAARRRELAYAIDDDVALYEQMRMAFRADQRSAPRDLPAESAQPLFIVGMPRTGTTLVERILSSHLQVASLGELQDFAYAVRHASGAGSSSVLDGDVIRAAAAGDPRRLAQAYLEARNVRLARGDAGARYVIDKMPLNFLYIGFILQAFPAARVVVLRRGALDTCLSNYRQLFAVNHSYYNYHYDLADTARYFLLFDALLAHWLDRFGERILQLSYEELVREPKPQINRVLDYLDLPWQDACLAFHENPAAVATPSAMQVREPLYASAIGRWRHYAEPLAPAMAILDAAGISYD